MRARYVLAAATLVVAAATSGCEPTGDPRCDQHADAIAVADQLGYVIDCTPPASYPLGWADHEHRTLFVHADRLSSDGALAKVMWHETGHADFAVHGRTFPTQRDEECAADAYAAAHMSAEQRAGVGFLRC